MPEPDQSDGADLNELSLFSKAIELPVDQRGSFLDQACGDDTAMRNRIESLIENDLQADEGDFLAPAAMNLKSGIYIPSPGSDLIGKQIGPFKVVRKIGQGGMGAVYLAERIEGYDQQVAIKVMRFGIESQDMARRFRDEAQFTAALGKHPNIANLIDAGSTEDGIFYLVMDYVDGIRLDQYCDEHQLGLNVRLELFLSVCDAVQFAHRNAVIHRDLKPSNILVTDDGQVKLIDFGIAKLTSAQKGLESEATHTLFRVFTPDFASPEQARGEPPTTSSDVYSLGVVLYRLLVGRSPYRVSTEDPSEMIRAIEMVQPLHPRQAVNQATSGDEDSTEIEIATQRKLTPTRLKRELAGDLGTIMMMALRKEASRRYGTVDQFADDLRRYLSGHPVRACKDTLRYRVNKFVRRNRLAVATAVLLLATLVAGTIGTATQWRRAEVERIKAIDNANEARAETQRARELAAREASAKRKAELATEEAKLQALAASKTADFMTGLFQGNDRIGMFGYQFGGRNEQERDPTVRELLERGKRQIETDLKDVPAVRANLMLRIAQIDLSMGSLVQAEPLLESALEIQRQLDAPSQVQLMETLVVFGLLRYIQGNYDAALEFLREGVQIGDQLYGEMSPRHANYKLVLGFVSLESCLGTKQWLASGEILRQVADIRRAQESPKPLELANALIGEAIFLRTRGQKKDNINALMLLGKASMALASTPDGGLYAESAILATQASVNWQAGNHDLAYQQVQDVLKKTKKILGNKHPLVNYIQIDQATRMFTAKQYDRAESFLRDGISMARQAYGSQPRTAQAIASLGVQLLLREVKLDEAESLLREAAAILEDTFGADHPRTKQVDDRLNQLLKLKAKKASANAKASGNTGTDASEG